jgi:hypothetical protein
MLSADVRVLGKESVARTSARTRLRISAGTAVFLSAFLLYVTLAALLVFGEWIIVPDAWSRVANAYYMLYSRDPHLAALGFFWAPLPSLAVLPLLPFSSIWPDLVGRAFAGNLMSAFFMAGAVAQLYGALRDHRVERLIALVVSGLFAINPMIAFHAANGLSEAPFIFFLVTAARYLARWIRSNTTASLVITGMALGAAYLTRYEALAAGAAATGLVGCIAAFRATGRPRERMQTGLADALIVGAPFAAAVGLWALAAWIIVGDPWLAYSATANINISLRSQIGGDSLGQLIRQVTLLQPFVGPIFVVALLTALLRRHAAVLGTMATVGAATLFAVLTVLTVVVPLLRYQITWIPLVFLIAVAAFPVRSESPETAGDEGWQRPFAPKRVLWQISRMALSLAIVVMLAASVPMSLVAMKDPSIGVYEELWLSPLFEGDESRLAVESRDLQRLTAEAAATIDGMQLDDGSILIDAVTGFAIIAQSDNPRQFVIPADRDFARVLLDPVTFGAEFLLVPGQDFLGVDSIRRAYPGLYDDGMGFATLVDEFDNGVLWSWRLYHLDRADRIEQ